MMTHPEPVTEICTFSCRNGCKRRAPDARRCASRAFAVLPTNARRRMRAVLRTALDRPRGCMCPGAVLCGACSPPPGRQRLGGGATTACVPARVTPRRAGPCRRTVSAVFAAQRVERQELLCRTLGAGRCPEPAAHNQAFLAPFGQPGPGEHFPCARPRIAMLRLLPHSARAKKAAWCTPDDIQPRGVGRAHPRACCRARDPRRAIDMKAVRRTRLPRRSVAQQCVYAAPRRRTSPGLPPLQAPSARSVMRVDLARGSQI